MCKIERSCDESILVEIEEELKSLSIMFNTLLLEYKDKGFIDEDEYEGLIKIKRDFLLHH